MSECPYNHDKKSGSSDGYKARTNKDWWPDSLNLNILHQDPISLRPSHVPHPSSATVAGSISNKPLVSPLFTAASSYVSYADKFAQLNLNELRNDIYKALISSNPSWPADYGHYGPFIVRLAWHSAGTYRVFDGRGGGNSGNIRLPPLNSWPDNGNLDKAVRFILWPIKRKYGQSISWADLIILSGNVAIESMMGKWGSIKPLWFGGGRIDAFQPEEDVYWGHEPEWLKDDRRTSNGEILSPLGAVQMGLIYVNPGDPDILKSAKDIRTTFSRMGVNDEETVALIAGGHTFGKGHGAADPSVYVGKEPEGASIEQMGLGWNNTFNSGKGKDTITSGLEGSWTQHPTRWDNGYFDLLFQYEWKKTQSPAGAIQWIPTDIDSSDYTPDAHEKGTMHKPIMFTTDLAMRYDPIYGPISQKYHTNFDLFTDAFKRAWYKLCHRDMGPISRHLGPYCPNESLIWLDPIPDADYDTISEDDIQYLKRQILDAVNCSKVSISDLVKTAWASASTYRSTDHRGGANGGRIRLEPQRRWAVNDPNSLESVISIMENLQDSFNQMQQQKGSAKRVSFSDLVVLGGNTAIEEAARRAGHTIRVPFVPGRGDALQSDTDITSFNFLQPTMDGFRNYEGSNDTRATPEEYLIDRSHLLTLTVPEMCVLIGGLRVLNANTDSSQGGGGVLTDRPGVLTNVFFINLLDENTVWSPAGSLFKGSRSTGRPWTASRVDLILGSNSQLRAVSESYASTDSSQYFIKDFINAWTKVMNLDRFDLLRADNANTKTESSSTFYWSSTTVSKL